MKNVIFCFLLFQLQASAQNSSLYHESIYQLGFKKTEQNTEINLIQAMLLADLKYIVKANDSIYSILTSGVGDNDGEHVHTRVSGPQKLYFDIGRDLVFMDDNISTGHRFAAVILKDMQSDTLIDKYKCKLFVSLNKDSLFITDQLPWQVNPFLLTNKSINAAVVKAIMANGSIYSLVKVTVKNGMPFEKLIFPENIIVKDEKNIFFR